MAFPSSPSNDDLHTEYGRTFKYSSATNSWSVATPDAPADTLPSSQAYVDVASLPLSGVVAGSTAFVQDGNKLFMFSGNGWFEIATINTAPTITQGANASYSRSTGGSPITIGMTATDPEGTPIVWSHAVTSGNIQDTAVSNDSSVFTIIPGSTPTTFNIAFTASDGVNIDTSSSAFTISVPFNYVGTTYGFWAGGITANSGTRYGQNVIDRIQFSNEVKTSGYAFLTTEARSGASGKSMTHGYILGTNNWQDSSVRKYPYASGQPNELIPNLITRTNNASGHSTDGYIYSANNGFYSKDTTEHLTVTKLAAAADTPATSLPNLMPGSKANPQGMSSATHAIVGHTNDSYGTSFNSVILGWSFANDTPTSFNPAFSSANTTANPTPTDFSTTDYGYQVFSTSNIGSGRANRLSFASGAGVTAVTDVGTRFVTGYQAGSTGTNDEVNGYTAGGGNIAATQVYYFQFANDTTRGNLGSLAYDQTNNGGRNTSQV
jgi:hypothetical protein